jgi:hypothetical protein
MNDSYSKTYIVICVGKVRIILIETEGFSIDYEQLKSMCIDDLVADTEIRPYNPFHITHSRYPWMVYFDIVDKSRELP